ncbi:MAG: sulfotransferase [Alphaproteobacteria bacterium]|nr:sulfotransferase [Alphaproteobacteria bacterium]
MPAAADSSRQLQEILKAVEALLRSGEVTRAAEVANQAVMRGAANPNLMILAALHNVENGAPGRALTLAARARELLPKSGEASQIMGLALAALGRPREAIEAFDESLKHQPRTANVHHHKGLALEELHEWHQAQAAYEAALKAEPMHAASLARLASLKLSEGDDDAARRHAERALGAKAGQPAASIVLAQLALNARDTAAVRDLVATFLSDPAVSPVNRAIGENLLGDALDAEGRPAEAFAHYRRCNDILKDHHRREYEAPGAERGTARARRIGAYFESADLARWRDCDAGRTPAPVDAHVFLVGFPRSGTTLLEQVLASHGAIESLEERDCLAAAMSEFVLPPGGLERLAALDGDALERYREAYWREARAGGAALDRPVFLDKLPLNALNLGVIAKLFPRAKILLALRDPRDVVLSCFRRRFEMSPYMYEMLSLDSAASFYAATIGFCDFVQANLTLPVFASRYEELVGDFEGRTRALCAFLGLAFDESMRAFAERTRGRMIRTPSKAQVARGLYTGGMQQWRAYEQFLAPAMPALGPWIEKLGYVS